jgi:peptidoglycan/LPS O-acetylase OafA/YrhL
VSTNGALVLDPVVAPAERPSERPAGIVSRILELDGLRGLAILMVIPCHYIADVPHGAPHTWASRAGSMVGWGGSGVDLFFILSGFLIGGILLDSKSSPNYFRTFYARRFFRILPLYYSVLFAYTVLWFASPALFHLGTPAWTYPLFLQNYFMKMAPVQTIWLAPMWSLAVEEQFYLTSPPLIRRLSTERVVQAMVSVVAIAFLIRMTVVLGFGDAAHDHWGLRFAYFGTPARADDLALGVLAAVGWRNADVKRWVQEHIALCKSAIFACIAAWAIMLPWTMRPFSYLANTLSLSVLGALYLCLMITVLLDEKGWLAKLCRWNALREMGKISYCVYLVHYPVLWIMHRLVLGSDPRFDTSAGIGVTLAAFAATLAIAQLSWRFFEHPLVRRGHAFKY